MKIHLLTTLCILVMVVSKQGRAQNIVAVHDGQGRTVWANNEEPKLQSPASAPAAQPRAEKAEKLVYWSRAEHRWKAVKTPSPSAMQAARQAAQEVASLVDGAPPAGKSRAGNELASPDRGRRISSKTVDEAIDAAASRHGVNANLVRAVIQVESNFNPHAVSRKGAMGLMQLMPYTAKSMNVTDAFDPRENVDAGVRHLKSLLQNYHGDLPLSLAAYNAGSGAVEKHKGIPPYRETRDYVKKITDLYQGPALAQAPLKPQIQMTRDSQGRLFFSTE